MGVSEKLAGLYLQLGIAGATLLILLIFIILLFKYVSKDNGRVEKLCDKIDSLVTSYTENTKELSQVLISNDKDQEAVIKLLTDINVSILDTQRRVVRIDDRTYHCLDPKVKKESEAV